MREIVSLIELTSRAEGVRFVQCGVEATLGGSKSSLTAPVGMSLGI